MGFENYYAPVLTDFKQTSLIGSYQYAKIGKGREVKSPYPNMQKTVEQYSVPVKQISAQSGYVKQSGTPAWVNKHALFKVNREISLGTPKVPRTGNFVRIVGSAISEIPSGPLKLNEQIDPNDFERKSEDVIRSEEQAVQDQMFYNRLNNLFTRDPQQPYRPF